MGIAISYNGSLDDVSRLDELVADVRQFCQSTGWEFAEISQYISGVALAGTAADFTGPEKREDDPEDSKEDMANWPEELTTRMGGLTLRFDVGPPDLLEETWRGILVNPPGTESVWFTFDGHGRLCHYVDVPQRLIKGKLKDQKHYWCFPVFTKTSGRVDEHIGICLLLKIVRDKYMKNLEVEDGTGYFETGDLKKLHADNAVMAVFLGALKSNPGFLATIFKAAGLPEEMVATAVPIESKLSIPIETERKAAKTTVQ